MLQDILLTLAAVTGWFLAVLNSRHTERLEKLHREAVSAWKVQVDLNNEIRQEFGALLARAKVVPEYHPLYPYITVPPVRNSATPAEEPEEVAA